MPVSIWGYQCKARDFPDSPPPHTALSASAVLRSHDVDPRTYSNVSEIGWKVAGTKERSELLGPTFSLLRLLEKPVNSVGAGQDERRKEKREEINREDPTKKANTK